MHLGLSSKMWRNRCRVSGGFVEANEKNQGKSFLDRAMRFRRSKTTAAILFNWTLDGIKGHN